MNEKIFDVLMYLFENYMENETEHFPDHDAIRTELLEAGFAQMEVNKAFHWLESLEAENAPRSSLSTFRIFSPQEQRKLDLECRNLLLFLEDNGVLSSANRELVIDRVMDLEAREIGLNELKWVILMVLLNQAEDEDDFSHIENMVYSPSSVYLH